jgi:LysW-gamma-L-alpha-aminoadipyl-6-phosphate/LysW-L-glutamyl-5-phosphate reductase
MSIGTNRKRFRASVIGGSGYGGGEMIRRLLIHPEVELLRVASIDHVGEPLSRVHPNLEGRTDLSFENLTPSQAAEGADVVLLGLPHKVAAAKVPALLEKGVKIVDLSGDFRLSSKETYRTFYGAEHPHPELLDGTFVYGLPEANRAALRNARAVASPGCFATCIELALLPLARAGLLRGPIETVAMTGSSGSGIAPSEGTHHPSRSQNLKTYKPLSHQHVPEIEELLGKQGAGDVQLRFVPVSAPLARGIFSTSFVHVPVDTTEETIRAAFEHAYRDEPFVRVPRHRLPEVVAVAGSNYVEVGFAYGPPSPDGQTRLVTCFSAIDNLIKGGAGQGIQNMNLLLGLDETLSLQDPGGYP